jgi:hypothetical protein
LEHALDACLVGTLQHHLDGNRAVQGHMTCPVDLRHAALRQRRHVVVVGMFEAHRRKASTTNRGGPLRVTIRLRGRALAEVIARNAGSDSGALAVSGVRAVVRCEGDRRVATLTRDDGRAVGDDEVLTVATNDYLASGSLRERAESPVSDDETLRAPTLRDAVIDVLRALGPTLSGEDPRWFEPARLRITLPGPRPVRCGG